MAVGDPVEVLIAHGLSPAAARPVAAVLTGPVAATMRALLPGIERGRAGADLELVSVSLRPVLIGAAQALIAGPGRSRVAAAALPVILLGAVAAELKRWRTAPGTGPVPTGPVPAAPCPAQPLVAARYEAAGQIMRAWAGTERPAQAAGVSSAARALVRELVGRGVDGQWTGWALLAALTAMDTHRAALPLPPAAGGRLAAGSEAGAVWVDAVQVGWALALSAALTLIADGEQGAAARAATGKSAPPAPPGPLR